MKGESRGSPFFVQFADGESQFNKDITLMIFIEKGESNKVVLTLWESATITSPYFMFKFTNSVTAEVNIFTALDTSDNPDRFSLFSIVEQPTGLDPATGIVSLTSGQWIGQIYESVTTSLDPDDWSALLQTEMVVVSGEDLTINPIYR